MAVNPVRNSSGVLNPVRDLSLNGINPALRGGTPHGAEPGIILKSNPAAAAGPEGLPPGHEPFRGGAWPGGSSGALFLTGQRRLQKKWQKRVWGREMFINAAFVVWLSPWMRSAGVLIRATSSAVKNP